VARTPPSGGKAWGARRPSGGPVGAIDSKDSALSFHTRFSLKETIHDRKGARVQLAEDARSGTIVAVKIADIRMQVAPGEQGVSGSKRNSAWQEAKLLQDLGANPYCVECLAYFADAAFSYTVMEHLPRTLVPALLALPDVTEPDYAALARSALQALQFVHSRGVMHRKVRPDSLAVTDLEALQVKLCDFALAGEVRHAGLPHNFVRALGSPAYTSPELLERLPHGPAADVWSLGVSVYVPMLGHLPYRALDGTNQAMKTAIVHGAPEPSFQPVPHSGVEVSGQARAFLQGVLVRDPVARPTAEEVLQFEWFQRAPRSSFPWPSLKPALARARKATAFEMTGASASRGRSQDFTSRWAMDRELQELQARGHKARNGERTAWAARVSDASAKTTTSEETSRTAPGSPRRMDSLDESAQALSGKGARGGEPGVAARWRAGSGP